MATVNTTTPTVYPKSHVGFDSITSQIEKKLLKRGFQFNVICVGTLSVNLSITRECPSNQYDRPDWTREIHPHQHHFRFASHGQ